MKDPPPALSVNAKLAAIFSLALWTTMFVMERLIAYWKGYGDFQVRAL